MGASIYQTGEEIRCPAYFTDRRHRQRDFAPERRQSTRQCGHPGFGRVLPGTAVEVRVFDPSQPGAGHVESCRECGAVIQITQVAAREAA